MADRLAELEQRRAAALAMGGPERVERHHASGRLTARERLDALVDAGSFFEIGLLAEPEHRREKLAPADAIVAGLARIGGRKVCVLAVDATVLAGTTGQVNMRKQNRIALWAGQRGLPLICLSDNDGGRIPDVMGWRFSGLPFDFKTFVQAPEGRPEVPRLIAVVGASFGDSALHAAMGHFVVMTKDSAIALSGPPVIAAAIGEELTADELGGPKVSGAQSGNAHLVVDDELAALAAIKRVLTYLPDSADHPAPAAPAVAPARDAEELLTLVPSDPRRGYDMRKVLEAIFDAGSIQPWGEKYGASVLCCLARIEGEAIGVVASQPMQRAGVMDVPALTKEAAFVDLCDTFNLPLVFLQDVPGPDDRLGRRARRHPRRLRARRRPARPGQGAEDRGRRAQGLRRRALRPRRPAHPPGPRPRLADGGDGLHGPGDGDPHRPPPQARGGARERGQGGARRASSRSCPPTGRGSPSPGRRPRTPTSTT